MPLLASQTIARDLRVLALNDKVHSPVYLRADVAQDDVALDAAAKAVSLPQVLVRVPLPTKPLRWK